VAARSTTLEVKVARLVKALRLPDGDDVGRVFRELWTAARLRPPDEAPRWSGVTDDSTPVEFSIQFRRQSSELRMLFESQGDPASPQTYWRRGTWLTRWLARRWNAHVEAAAQIEPLFAPARNTEMLVVIGHGVQVHRGHPVFKVYYNAMARGAGRARDVVGEALVRLGFERSWRRIEQVLRPLDRVEIVSLDLTARRRVKVYVRPLEAERDHIARLYALSEASKATDVARAWRAIHPAAAPERMRPVFVTYNLTEPASVRPSRASLSIPLFPGVADDAEARRRVSRLMREFGIAPAAYQRCVTALADRPLPREEGIHSYVALQRTDTDTAIVAYLNPRLYFRKYGWLARNPARTWPSPVVSRR
jgi:DMATS type aromatic prenyltransferase